MNAPRSGTAARIRVAVRVSLAVAVAGSVLFATRCGTRWPSIYVMTGPSMEPTLQAGEHFVAWGPATRVDRGDLVLFRFEDEDGVFHVLRRVVGLPGDRIAMVAGAALVNGAPQPWPHQILSPGAWRSPIARDGNLYDWGPWLVPSDSVALLADTRDAIGWPDSRFVGFVARGAIVARTTRTVWGRRLR